MIFEVGKWYENRRGKYQVLVIKSNQMQVKYANGEIFWFDANEQARIYSNIQAERAAQSIHKASKGINKTSGFYWLLGFLAMKNAYLLSFIPRHSLATYRDIYQDATGKELSDNQKGITIHPPETNKRWYECRINFRATPQEIKLVESHVPQFPIVKADDRDGWNINNNKLFFALLEYGFLVGENEQRAEIIKGNIPTQYISSFEAGYARANN